MLLSNAYFRCAARPDSTVVDASEKANMSVLSDGRNEIPVGNSNAKCLLENWVEEVSMIVFEERKRYKGTTASVYVHHCPSLLDYTAQAHTNVDPRKSYPIYSLVFLCVQYVR